MRFVTMRTGDATRAGRLDGDIVVELPAPDVGALLAHPAGLEAWSATTGPVHELASVDLAPLVSRPGRLVCVGLNYESHIAEMGRERPRFPTLFAKFGDALIGPTDPISLPPESERVDWEGELAAIVGRSVRRANPDEAAAAIAGFTVCNDVTMRDWQRRTSEWLQGKSWSRSTPIGPHLVTPDEVGGVRPDLQLTVDVDDERMQDGRTSDLVFDMVELVSYISTFTELGAGDVISSGTPSGVGDGRRPPVYLRDGQVVRATIEGIGATVNRCVAARAPTHDATPAR
jgi:acylpyruvate hydrolase